tara:strand:+ start:1985 stop:2977 length:993 start_codon:yes stop_codon:yes gene_type:complete
MAIHFYSDIHLNANKLGRDADNLLDFSTDNEITFRVGAGDGVIFKASGEIEATKFDGALEGNADTATALETARTIAGVSFDGTANISLNNNAITNGAGYTTSSGDVTLSGAQTFTGVKTFGTTTKLQFRDANAYINSPTANDIEIAATTITLDAASDIQLEQDTTVTGNLTVTGRATSTDDYHGESFENQLSASVGHGRILKYSPGSSGGLTASQIYYLREGGTWSLADADDVAKGGTQLLGIGMGEDPQTVGVFMEGFFRVASTEILNTPGSGNVDGLPLYVSTTDGHFDFTAPSESGDYVRIVGYAIDDDSGDVLVYFDPSKDHIVLA